MRLCIERILPPCRERMVKFPLPPIESAADIAPTMKAVAAALAGGVITPGEAGTIAAVVSTFVRAIETSDFERRPKIVEAEHAARPAGVPEMFDADNAGNSIYWRDLAVDSRSTCSMENPNETWDCCRGSERRRFRSLFLRGSHWLRRGLAPNEP